MSMCLSQLCPLWRLHEFVRLCSPECQYVSRVMGEPFLLGFVGLGSSGDILPTQVV